MAMATVIVMVGLSPVVGMACWLVLSHRHARLTASTEFLGGLLVLLGLGTRLVSLPLAFTMVVAILTAQEHNHPLAAFCSADGVPDDVAGRAERAVRTPTRGLDANLAAGHLGSQGSEAMGELKAVGDQYNPDQITHTPLMPALIPNDRASLHYRQEFSNAE